VTIVTSNTASVLLNNGDGSFSAPTSYPVGSYPTSIAAADLDGDGSLDLISSNRDSDNASLLMNNGNGTFAAAVDIPAGDGPRDVLPSDLDNDGDTDLAFANSLGPNIAIVMNNGPSGFGSPSFYGTGSQASYITGADYDADGDIDLAVCKPYVSVLFNDGDGVFENQADHFTTDIPKSMVSADFDGDFDIDILAPNYGGDDLTLMLNDGCGDFPETQSIPCATEPHDALAADLDDDGDLEILAVKFGTGRLAVYSNQLWPRSMIYWRRIAATGVWEGPVAIDHEEGYNHHVAVDPVGDKLGVIYRSDGQIFVVQSGENGGDWLSIGAPQYPQTLVDIGIGRLPITSVPYSGTLGNECTGEYDFDSDLHVVWPDADLSVSPPTYRLQHWRRSTLSTTTIRELSFEPLFDFGIRDLALCNPQISFGDGSTTCTDGPGDQTNRNYVYLIYGQYGGATSEEQYDGSEGGCYNLEIYLQASNDGGQSWAPALNLTNTKTPNCPPGPPWNPTGCASERDASLARTVNDALHISYVLDRNAGDGVYGQGATGLNRNWTINPFMYYRIPGGTDAWGICPDYSTPCDCPHQGEWDVDGFITALDLGGLIDVLFAGRTSVQDPDCPTDRLDFDCDCFVTAVDLAVCIDFLFNSGPGPCDPCTYDGGQPIQCD
jgi:hypothetical protein